mgnify:FL=1
MSGGLERLTELWSRSAGPGDPPTGEVASRLYAPRVKICGLTRPEDIACVNRSLPDLVGFVFAPASRRTG